MIGFYQGRIVVIPNVKIQELAGLSSVKGTVDGQEVEIPAEELAPFSDDDCVTPIASEEELC